MPTPDWNKLMEYSLSDDDLKDCLKNPDVKIIIYPKLKSETPDTLFGPGGYTVLLFLTESMTHGHWLVVLSHPGERQKIEVFDSFGTPIDGDRRWVSERKLTSLHELAPLLSEVLRAAKESGCEIEHNTHKFQGDCEDTCGRHVAARLMCRDKSLQEYIHHIKSLESELGCNADEVVTRMTYATIHK
jgi:hypothetical protein